MFMSDINIEKFDSYIRKKLDETNPEDQKLQKKIYAIYSPQRVSIKREELK